jgi:hypothetical protein
MNPTKTGGEHRCSGEVEAHIGPGQYGPRYGNDLVVIQKPVIFPGCENMDSLLPLILVIQKCLYLN